MTDHHHPLMSHTTAQFFDLNSSQVTTNGDILFVPHLGLTLFYFSDLCLKRSGVQSNFHPANSGRRHNHVTDNRPAVAAALHTGASHLLTEGLERPLLSRHSYGL